MENINNLAKDFVKTINSYSAITVVAHINPDPDTIGTALGVYAWLRENGHRAELVCQSSDIAIYLDFLPHFSKIKNHIDYQDSLVITCDCGSIDRAGFDLQGRDIINIDHHPSNTNFGIVNIVDPKAVSSSQVAFELLSQVGKISKQSATAFYTALVSDSKNFTTSSVNAESFQLASRLIELGVDISEVSYNLTQRKSLSWLRILSVAIDSLELISNARVAIMTIYADDMKRAGAKMSDLDGVVEYARSLATVQIAILILQRDKDIKVSLRSKGADVGEVAGVFDGGGHRVAAGFEISYDSVEKLKESIIKQIQDKGLLK